MRRVSLRLALAAASTVAAVGLVEAGLRLARDPNTFLPYPRHAVQLFYPSEAITPGVTGTSRFTTNRFGCRGPEPDGERFKMLTIGGSTTACSVLDDSETWPQLLMDGINRRAGDPRFLWVTNSGQDGKNSRHHVLHARYLLPVLPKLDFVLLCSGLNDAGAWLYRREFDPDEMENPDRIAERMAETFRGSGFTAESAPWFRHLEVWKLASNFKNRLWNRMNPEPPGGALLEDAQLHWMQAERERRARRAKALVPAAKRETLPLALEFYAKNLRTIARCVRENGAEPIFMTQATQAQGLSEAQKRNVWTTAMDGGETYLGEEELERVLSEFNATMARVAAEERVHLVDLEKLLLGHPEYYYDAFHLNEVGCRVAADKIANDLFGSVIPK